MFDPKPHLIQLPRKVKDRKTGEYTVVYDAYLEVKWRVVLFRQQCPHGSIITEEIVVDLDRGYARYKAIVDDGDGGTATGYGTETQADFGDFAERAETRAIGRALALMGFGTQFVGQDLTEGEHIADAPVVNTNAESNGSPAATMVEPRAVDPAPPAPDRISRDQARELKKLAQLTFGFADGERRLRADLGFEREEKLTSMHLAAHVPPARWQTLMADSTAQPKAAVEADVP